MPFLKFRGKDSIVNHHLTVPYHHLQALPRKSILRAGANPSLHENMVIHGDNLLALKALLPTHAGRVNCVYIDPPYNTGNEGWAYNDNVNNAMFQKWLKANGIDAEDEERHDKWCCMMWPRLTFLHELLAEDGVIFVSIDDNEQHHLRVMMDEIFGERNFIETLIWKKKGGAGNTETKIGDLVEYVHVYAKDASYVETNRRMIESVRYPHRDDGGAYRLQPLTKTDEGEYRRDTMKFGVSLPDGGDGVVYPPQGKRWTVGHATMTRLQQSGLLHFEQRQGGWDVRKKDYFDATDPQTGVYLNLLLECGSLQSAKTELTKIGFRREQFDTPKPTTLVEHLLRMVAKPDSIILDSFAGSGTTAHAVMQLNAEDGGRRKFVLVECEDYADGITAERVRRVIRGVPRAKDAALQAGLGGHFGYWQLGGELQVQGLLDGDDLPTYEQLASYIFYTATGEQWSRKLMKKRELMIGESARYRVYLLYRPDVAYLRKTALTLDFARALPAPTGKWRLVFAPVRYAELDELDYLRIKFCQLPFEIYRLAG